MLRRESPPPTHPRLPEEFSSWKEIASYLGVSVRRAQQWETELGLPVERFSTEQRARIRARRSEIDRWLRERTGPGAAARLRRRRGLVPEQPSTAGAAPAAAGPARARLGSGGSGGWSRGCGRPVTGRGGLADLAADPARVQGTGERAHRRWRASRFGREWAASCGV